MDHRRPKHGRASAALAVTRPGGAVEAIVDTAIVHLSAIYHRGAISTVVAIGDYLIKTFFAGDLDLASSHHPKKAAAMNRLLQRVNETPLSAHILKKAIPISVQYRLLPRKVADQLPQSHHEQLLLVGDVAEKGRLAADAVTRNLTVRQLDSEIRKIKRKNAGGRKAQPPVVRWAKGVRRATTVTLSSSALTAAAMRTLSPEDARLVEQSLRAAREDIERVTDALARHRRG